MSASIIEPAGTFTLSNWQCPYCNQFTFVTHENRSARTFPLNDKSTRGDVGMSVVSITCANPECQELTVDVVIGSVDSHMSRTNGRLYDLLPMPSNLRRRVVPEAKVMALPSEVPEEVKITYSEAVLIANLSGRAAAAMARRCLQGIVRDFFQIPQEKRGNLGAELNYVKDQISPDLWADIIALRNVGDIGAHMDKNVNEIIDVSHDEAKILIELIETLFSEWYVARAKRQQRSASLAAMLTSKREAQKAAKEQGRESSDSGEV